MYVLTRLIHRYETNDTALIYGSEKAEPLQELILSAYQETEYEEFNELVNQFNMTVEEAYEEAHTVSTALINDFYIVKIPVITD